MLDGRQVRSFIAGALIVCSPLVVAGCQTTSVSPETTSSLVRVSETSTQGALLRGSDSAIRAYRLDAGDKLGVSVFGENELSGEFLVGDNGRVDLPLIGAVDARGLTVSEFQNAVVTRYRDGYLKDPKISVSVLNYRPFFITGEVGKGGEYPFKAGLTIQDAVAIAGGYTYRANTGKAFVRKAGQDREIAVELDQRVAINPGDIVRIPERFF